MALEQRTAGSEDVNDFLVRIRELGEKRDKEDEERARRLEAEILQGRRERQARRAERARSISPTKDSPLLLGSPTLKDLPMNTSTPSKSIIPPIDLLPTTKTLDLDTASRDLAYSSTASNEDTDSRAAESIGGNTTRPPDRTRAMSWKQRPQSSEVDTLASTLRFPSDPPNSRGRDDLTVSANDSESTMSRAQISQSLGSKDPSWFKQTSDRGIGSPACRKASSTPLADVHLPAASVKLPGLTKEPTLEPDKGSSYDGSERSRSPSRANSVYGSSNFGNRYSSISSVTTLGGLGSPVPLSNPHRLESRGPESLPADRVAMSPSQSRLASDRPSSPTKGLGGFVQSAMMKRSDSVSKRWSTQSGPNSFRNSFISSRGEASVLNSPKAQLGPATAESTSRPASSHSEATVVRHSVEDVSSAVDLDVPQDSTASGQRFTKASPLSNSGLISDQISPFEGLPVTPSKTMDPKRWSPTKSSWLESAINRPESPRPKATVPSQEPDWKRGLTHKLRTSRDIGQGNKALDSISTSMPSEEYHRLPTASNTKTSSKYSQEPLENVDTDLVEETRTPRMIEQPDDEEKLRCQFPDIPPKSQGLESKIHTLSLKNEQSSSPPDPDSQSSIGDKQTPHPDAAMPPLEKPLSSGDFRANLRPRGLPTDKSNAQEPEFKSVFGKLRRTETKNYVAPDEFKDNILRGKAALNITGGPKRTPRVDEFKESILKQKKAMKAGGGSIRRTTNDPKRLPGDSDSSVPEAIAKRMALSRSESARSIALNQASSPTTHDYSQSNNPHPYTRLESAGTSLKSRPNSPTKQPSDTMDLTLSKALRTPENPPKITEEPLSTSSMPPIPAETNLSCERPKTKLNERLNPALAGIIARGPRSERPSRNPAAAASAPRMTPKDSPPAPLTHMTKARAKGPKRRLPQKPGANQKAVEAERANMSPVGRPESVNAVKVQQLAKVNGEETPISHAARASSVQRNGLSVEGGTGNKPAFSSTSHPELNIVKPLSKPTKLSISTEPSNRSFSTPKASTTPFKPDDRPVIQREASSPVLLTANLPDIGIEQSGASAFSSPVKISQSCTRGLNKKSSEEPVLSPVGKRVVSPPVPPKPMSISDIQPGRESIATPFPQTPEATRIFSDFFNVPPTAKSKVDIDPLAFLPSSQEQCPKSTTIKQQTWEFGGDGRRTSLPANQEYILFEENMYLCIRTFETANGTRTTQTNLWCGDGVSEATIEDVQLFARKLARENNSKLVILRQGKETASFIQALGGIILTRRGSSSRADNSEYMLCGRRHLGQITFDEVDLSPECLCSGYPYIISTKSGKLYLWKGKGSTADELGCARLIGMDLAGEIEEVTEGQEPSGFFDSFPTPPGVRAYSSATYWRFKASNEKYCCRLFRIDHELGQGFGAAFWNRRGAHSPVARPNDTVQAIKPFCQRDLDPEHIYVLDTFFEIYVIVGELARSRSAEFASALVFAQEYGFLAVSEQDRPFLPKSHVCFNGLTDECKRAFRKWDDRIGGFENGKPPRVFPLSAAIEAIR
ncbi:hypothetical protein LOZ42_000485 [Ophidiomyces ophidiicola]|nr:hypothetical protein LOZ42_000485 [Ophidiomyces ophidiicola]